MTNPANTPPTNDVESARLRARLAAALAEAEGSDVLSAALRRLQDAEGIDAAQMAARLRTTTDGLSRLALCRPPRDTHFTQDVSQIADYCGCDAPALLSLLRRAQVLAAFAEPAPALGVMSAANERLGWLSSSAALVAARDAEAEEEDTEGNAPDE